jgi:hypothetical protein
MRRAITVFIIIIISRLIELLIHIGYYSFILVEQYLLIAKLALVWRKVVAYFLLTHLGKA